MFISRLYLISVFSTNRQHVITREDFWGYGYLKPKETSALDLKMYIEPRKPYWKLHGPQWSRYLCYNSLNRTILYMFWNFNVFALFTDRCRVLSLLSATPLNALVSKRIHVARAAHSDGALVLSFLEAQLHWMACLEIKRVTPGVNILSPHVWIYQSRKYKWKIKQQTLD